MHELEAMNRRALIQRMALLLGASAIPAEAFAAVKGRAKQRFLAPAQFATLSAVADTILPTTDTPGALAAGVPAKLDGMLANWASATTRTALSGALGRIDAAAKTQKGKGFAALSVAERVALLKPHDAAALKSTAAPPGAPKVVFFSPTTYVTDQGYFKLKELVINLYYYSEIATSKELVYEHVPGTYEPSIKLTPQSRPHLGVGPF